MDGGRTAKRSGNLRTRMDIKFEVDGSRSYLFFVIRQLNFECRVGGRLLARIDLSRMNEREKCALIRVALALMLAAATMMPVIFTNRECFRNSTHNQPLDCLWNTGRPEKNSNNKQAVIDQTSLETTKNRKIPRVHDMYIAERKTHLNILDLLLAIRMQTSNFIGGDFSGRPPQKAG